MQNKPAYLVLANGRVFKGNSIGSLSDAIGEIVFTTAMTGYLETLTDPSYSGQIVIQTFPLIGNYGVTPDAESNGTALSAYIVRDLCQEPSNFRCEGALDVFLSEHNVPGIAGVDTRALTRIVREVGVMAAKVVHEYPADLDKILAELDAFTVKNPVERVTCKAPHIDTPENSVRRVVLWDFGTKGGIRRELMKRGCEVVTVPASATLEEIMEFNPSGVMLSNGPGDPTDNVHVIGELKKLLDSGLPVFGICLGHQLMALASGMTTTKLKYGHRGGNQPAIRTSDKRVFITSQNHGYAICENSLVPNARISYINGNDGTVEGIDYLDRPAFSVQFHPEASGGPLDTQFLFDRFISMMEGK